MCGSVPVRTKIAFGRTADSGAARLELAIRVSILAISQVRHDGFSNRFSSFLKPDKVSIPKCNARVPNLQDDNKRQCAQGSLDTKTVAPTHFRSAYSWSPKCNHTSF